MSSGTSCTPCLNAVAFHDIVKNVQYKDWVLRYSAHAPAWPEDSYFLLWWQFTSVDYTDPARVVGLWDGRKHHVPAFASEEQVVRTAFLAAKLCEEHEAAEAFNYAGVRVFDPHKEGL